MGFLRRFKNFYFLIGVLVTTFMVFILMTEYTDSDMWFILSSGREIVENGIPYTNPFTYIGELDIVIQQWLWCVIVWLVYSFSGGIGLFLTCIMLYFISVYLICKIAEINNSDTNFTFMVASLLFMVSGWFFISIRPTMVTVSLLLLQIYLSERYIYGYSWKNLLWFIPISLLEINLHSSLWVMHFIFIIPYVFPSIKNALIRFSEKEYSIKPFLYVIIPMALVGLLNPYGVDGILYLFNSYGSDLNSLGIAELSKPTIVSLQGLFTVISWLYVAYVLFSDRYREWDSHIIYFFLGLSALGVMHGRNAIYYLIGLILFIIYNIKNERKEIYVSGTDKMSYVIPIMALAILIPRFDIVNNEFDMKDTDETPIKAVEYIKENNLEDKNIYTDFNQGAFLEYNGINIFMEARPELYSKKVNNKVDILGDYVKYIMKDVSSEKYKEFLDKYKFDCLCVSEGNILSVYLDGQGEYKLVVEGEGYRLYEVIR